MHVIKLVKAVKILKNSEKIIILLNEAKIALLWTASAIHSSRKLKL